VGKTEQECQEEGLRVGTGFSRVAANGLARAMGEREGLVKVVADGRSDRVLGLHILGPRASEPIVKTALAIEFGASVEDIARTSHAHPTLAEAGREAAFAVAKRRIHS
jgi:dihydrolipoamide dehydrogenase